nr:MAG TPA: hypothetical protein [Caudoviricetes sp.]
MARKKKKIVKTGWLLPYYIWDALKQHPAEVVKEAIDMCVEYDRNWLERYEKTTAKQFDENSQPAAMAFSFAKQTTDINNCRYFGISQSKKEKKEQGGIDDSIPY